ncbi:MAG TPA: hypothetical protein VFD20_01880 [Demequina sp.]|nr:hypothetical protein [Demequina sp.]
MCLIALAILMSMGRPVIFVHVRPGWHGSAVSPLQVPHDAGRFRLGWPAPAQCPADHSAGDLPASDQSG